ncbi:TPA: hypothetical protein HA278_03940 [Candidatus Woesearchaeota archaeon]|nr:hypothetical protein [archaeon]HIJ11181.1 hypothetical protein [Candidatus Woesearchaeota archaeon]
MVGVFIPIALAIVVGLVEIWSKQFNLRKKPYDKKLMSFFAGISITYILLELFPRFTEAAVLINKYVFLSVLVGFITHHLVEKEIYKHNHRHELIKMLSLEERIFYFIYHFIFGVVLVTVLNQSFVGGMLFFVSILSYTLVSNLPASKHRSFERVIFYSSSTLLGVLFHLFIWKTIPHWLEISLIGLAVGVLLFTVTRHHIPFGRKGKTGWFTAGFIAYSLLIIISWFFR